MLKPLTHEQLQAVIGMVIAGYTIVKSRRYYDSNVTDYNCYGIALAENDGKYVTWRFHYESDGKVDFYWGHYYGSNKSAAEVDYADR